MNFMKFMHEIIHNMLLGSLLLFFLSLSLSFFLSYSFLDWTWQRRFLFSLGSPALITPACHLMWQPAYYWRSSRLAARGLHRPPQCALSSFFSSSSSNRRCLSMCSQLSAVFISACLSLSTGAPKLSLDMCAFCSLFSVSVFFFFSFSFFFSFVLTRVEKRDEFLTVRLRQAV